MCIRGTGLQKASFRIICKEDCGCASEGQDTGAHQLQGAASICIAGPPCLHRCCVDFTSLWLKQGAMQPCVRGGSTFGHMQSALS